ncbi:putative p34-cdc2 protein [Monocercomonoides exilis]|uniref:putative p34-cdc2 protein n=1 Tax=Monocercomonoides exilis TaxID=2049356 RepID=UPI00355A3F01|nr:putative p34-cdc2 protein [Monocercomonoides exilis]|eukprot:MONOS_13596.1-p1 / transcript=MONOS_13596.1 / gene=MONOS_13596 / organism=Monocercomonoides_exilis_PA203 / gene_product=p34-cdc2 protein / transcript_product=p34-cdc2 protein / location=Mono_scaffold00851:12416-14043(+) / protein_length=389 / sequence_SO=supercontig / SO=protein_coding / is_pseudo=false
MSEKDKLSQYEKKEVIGNGSYGKVHRAICKETGKEVALKRFKQRTKSKETSEAIVREISLHKSLESEHIVKYLDSFQNEFGDYYVAYELMKSDLGSVLVGMKGAIPLPIRKAYIKQVLQAVKFCHEKGILHRDLKPENFLIAQDRSLKLTDFGFSIDVSMPFDPSSSPIISRWYQAPELIFGTKNLNFSSDIWSVGCILGEMMHTERPLFKGLTDIDQLTKIFTFLGTPQDEEWHGMKSLPRFIPFEPIKGIDLNKFFSSSPPSEIALLTSLLSLDPSARPSAEEALKHPYFSEEPHCASLEELPHPDQYERQMKRYKKRIVSSEDPETKAKRDMLEREMTEEEIDNFLCPEKSSSSATPDDQFDKVHLSSCLKFPPQLNEQEKEKKSE